MRISDWSSDVCSSDLRWVKLTEESATLVKKHGLRKSSKSGLSTGVVKGSKGQVKGFVEFVKTTGSLLNNPALMAGAAEIGRATCRERVCVWVDVWVARRIIKKHKTTSNIQRMN